MYPDKKHQTDSLTEQYRYLVDSVDEEIVLTVDRYMGFDALTPWLEVQRLVGETAKEVLTAIQFIEDNYPNNLPLILASFDPWA